MDLFLFMSEKEIGRVGERGNENRKEHQENLQNSVCRRDTKKNGQTIS